MGTIGTLPGERLAGLSADLFHKLQSGSITVDELALFTQRKNPFAFERNQHGHVIITVTGLNMSGEQEVRWLPDKGYRVSDYAKSILTSTAEDRYDANHRLQFGCEYTIAFMPGKEISRDADRTTDALRKRGLEFGYQKPPAGIMPRIRASVSDKQMEEMGIWYIAALHDPIKDSDGNPRVLDSDRNVAGLWLGAHWARPGAQWDACGAFAFLVPAS